MKKIIEVATAHVEKLDSIIDSNYENANFYDLELFLREIKGTYHSIIKDFSSQLHDSYSRENRQGMRLSGLDSQKIKKDIVFVNARLKSFITTDMYTLQKEKMPSGKTDVYVSQVQSNTNTNSNSNTINVSLDNVVETIKNDVNLTEEEIRQMVEKLNSIEDILLDSTLTKPKKWSGIKDVAKYFLDKSLNVAISVLPYILESANKI
jgi:hypothetical protein